MSWILQTQGKDDVELFTTPVRVTFDDDRYHICDHIAICGKPVPGLPAERKTDVVLYCGECDMKYHVVVEINTPECTEVDQTDK